LNSDTASVYRNEEEIGNTLKLLRIPRENIFITSKLSARDHGYENTLKAFERTIQFLGVDYLDLYLVPWPGVSGVSSTLNRNFAVREQTWRAMEELYKQGKCRAIGVSNYTISHLESLLSKCKIVPAVNQVEMHPRLPQQSLIQYCNQKKIQVVAYSSLGRNSLIDNAIIKKISQKHNRTPAQILLRWAVQQDIPVLPKSIHSNFIKENIQLFDFTLDEEDFNEIKTLNDGHHYCWNPENVE